MEKINGPEKKKKYGKDKSSDVRCIFGWLQNV
jgi:hypothetical protein